METNLYGYSFSDPVNFIDPTGLFGISDLVHSIGKGLAVGAVSGIVVGTVATPATGFAVGLTVAVGVTAIDVGKTLMSENPDFFNNLFNVSNGYQSHPVRVNLCGNQ